MKTLVHAAGAALLLAAPLAGHALTLVEAYEQAQRGDPQFRAALKEQEAGSKSRELGRAFLLPSVALSYSNLNTTGDRTVPGFLGTPTNEDLKYRSVGANLSVRQPLLNFDGLARYRIGQGQADYADAVLRGRLHELQLRLLEAWNEALFARDQLELARRQSETLREQVKLNSRLLGAGEGTRTDLLETQAQLDLSLAREVEARDNVQNTRRALEGILGRTLAPEELPDPLRPVFAALPLEPADADAWRTLALERSPLLAAQRLLVEGARLEVERNEAGHYPRVDLVGNVNRSNSESISTINQRYATVGIGFQVNVPLYSGGAVQASIEQSAANLGRAQAELDARTDGILLEVKRQHAAVKSGQTRIAALDKALESVRLLIQSTQKSIQGGVRINLDLLTAQQQLYTVLRDQAQARYVYLNAWLRLRAAAGMAGDDEMRLLAAQFQPAGAPALAR